MTDNVEVITTLTYIYFVFLLIALIIERILEVLMAIFNYFEIKTNLQELWNWKARKYQRRYERLYGYQGVYSEKKKVFDTILWKVISEPAYPGGKPIISANLIRLNYVRVATRLLSLYIAFVLVYSQGLDLFQVLEIIVPETTQAKALTQYQGLRYFVTALIISIGTDPLHQLISRIEKYAQERYQPNQGGEA
jgi:hypothetical protein